MTAASKTAPTKKSLGGNSWEADPLPVGEGRRYGGSNEQEHSVSHRGRGPDIQARARRDTSGRPHSQQELAITCKDPPNEAEAEVGGRELGWRVSSYEQ